MRKNNSGWLRLAVITITMLALIIPALPASAEGSTVDLVFSPSTRYLAVGENFTVTIQAQCGSKTVDGIDIYLEFDPVYLAIQSATAGTALSAVFTPPTYVNLIGSFNFSAGQLAPPYPSINFTVVTIVFQAKAITTAPTEVKFSTFFLQKTTVDWNGEDITGTLTGGAYAVLNNTPPSVTSVSLAGSAMVPVNSKVVATFSKPMNHAATQGAFNLSPSVNGSFSWNPTSNEMTFTPTAGLSYSTAYSISISIAARDAINIPLAAPYASIFTTERGLTSISVAPANPVVIKGHTQQFTATPNYSDGTHSPMPEIAWSSSDNSKVTINSSGLATSLGVTASPVTITASSGSVRGTAAMSVISAEIISISVSPPNSILAKGRTQQFTATGNYSDATTGDVTASIAWSSSDTSKALINNTGLATAMGITTSPVIITATSGAYQATATLNVTAAELAGIIINPPNPAIARGRTQQFTAVPIYSDGTHTPIPAFTWSSSDAGKVSIDEAGLATAVNITVSPVNITAASGSIQGTAAMSVTAPELTGIIVSPPNLVLGQGKTQQFTASGFYSDSSSANITASVTWSSSDAGKVFIDSQGLAVAVDVTASPVTITAASDPVRGTAAMNVIALVNLVITPSSVTAVAGETFVLDVEALCGPQPADSISVYLDFDPAYLAVQSATAGNALPDISVPPEWDNNAGHFGFSAVDSSADPPAGTFSVVNITFLAKKDTATPSAISFHALGYPMTKVERGAVDITGAMSGASVGILVNVPLCLDPAFVPRICGGQTFNMDIKTSADSTQQISGIQAFISFDSSKLEVIDADAEQPGIQIISGTSLNMVISNMADNTGGMISFSAGKLKAPFPSGSFTVATIPFRVKSVTADVTTPVLVSLTGAYSTSLVDLAGTAISGIRGNASVQIIPGSDVTFNLGLQGGSRPASGWVVPLTVKLFTPGAASPIDVLSATPVFTYHLTTAKNVGVASAYVAEMPPGTYDISVVTQHCLTNVKRGVAIVSPSTIVNMGILLEGNANDDNKINIQDFGALVATYGKLSSDAGYDSRADFDRNNKINIADFGLLAANYGIIAPVTITVP